jgi:hypothetical protein
MSPVELPLYIRVSSPNLRRVGRVGRIGRSRYQRTPQGGTDAIGRANQPRGLTCWATGYRCSYPNRGQTNKMAPKDTPGAEAEL